MADTTGGVIRLQHPPIPNAVTKLCRAMQITWINLYLPNYHPLHQMPIEQT